MYLTSNIEASLIEIMGTSDVSNELIVFGIMKRTYYFFDIFLLSESKQIKFHTIIDKTYLQLFDKKTLHSSYSLKSYSLVLPIYYSRHPIYSGKLTESGLPELFNELSFLQSVFLDKTDLNLTLTSENTIFSF